MNTDEATGGIAAAASGKLSGKRTEADIYATFMSVSVFLQFWGLLRYLHCENSTKDIPYLKSYHGGNGGLWWKAARA